MAWSDAARAAAAEARKAHAGMNSKVSGNRRFALWSRANLHEHFAMARTSLAEDGPALAHEKAALAHQRAAQAYSKIDKSSTAAVYVKYHTAKAASAAKAAAAASTASMQAFHGTKGK